MALVELVIKIACVTLYRLPAGSLNVANGETQTSNVVGNPVGIKSCIDYPRIGGVRLLLVHSLKWCPFYFIESKR